MIQREIIADIEKRLGEEKILILKGPRQIGKTTIMHYFQEKLEKEGKKTLYFNADLELGNVIFANSKNFINFITTQLGAERLYIFIDEFQYIHNAGLFLKGVYDMLKKEVQIIVSGSSSLEITKNSEFLTGRKIDFEVNGISFYEYINYASKLTYKKYPLEKIYEVGFNVDDIKTHLLNYLNYGSYPEVLTTNDPEKRKIILKEIISTYISKDISGFMKISEIGDFNNLLKLLASQIGNLIKKSEIGNVVALDYRKLNHFLDILVGTYVINLLSPFFTNTRKEISKMPKVYFNNLSVVHYFTGNYLDSLEIIDGSFIENFVCNSLKSQGNLKFYHTVSDAEVDFILKKNAELIPIEVKFRNTIKNLPIAMFNFIEKYKKQTKRQILITKNTLEKKGDVYKVPYYLVDFIEL